MSLGDEAMLDERSLTSAQHDQPAVGAPSARLVVCTTPRSGSYLLARQLIRAGIGVPHEYLNPVNVRDIVQRAGTSSHGDYLDWLERNRTTPNGVFAVKLHWPQIATDPLALQRWLTADESTVLVYLYRRGISAQAHSLQQAGRTGVWEAGGEVTTAAPRGIRALGFDDLDRLTFRVVQWNAWWRLAFEGWGVSPLEVAYEDLIRDQTGVIRRIADRLGVEARVPPPEPAPDVEPGLRRMQRDRVIDYALTWTPPSGTLQVSTRRLARAALLDAMRATGRQVTSRVTRPGS